MPMFIASVLGSAKGKVDDEKCNRLQRIYVSRSKLTAVSLCAERSRRKVMRPGFGS